MTKKRIRYTQKTYVLDSFFVFFVDIKHAGVSKGNLSRNAAYYICINIFKSAGNRIM